MPSLKIVCPSCHTSLLASSLTQSRIKCGKCGATFLSVDSSEATVESGVRVESAPSLSVDDILADQRRRQREGTSFAAETYLDKNPTIASDADAALDVIFNEIILRHEQGETPILDEYVQRFPQYADQLQVQFEVEQALNASALLDGDLPTGFESSVLDHDTDAAARQADPGANIKLEQHPSADDNTRGLLSSRKHRTPPLPLDIPQQMGRYKILGEIARGGMGAVFRAEDPDIQRTLAVKVILPNARKKPDAISRFLEEARITGRLQHPGVAPIHELGCLEDGRPFFAMKLIEGETLAQLLSDRESISTDLPRMLNIFEQICQTLAFAHSRNIIHRDLKPANIMVGAFGEVQVMDWGLAKRMKDEDGRMKDERMNEQSDGESDSSFILHPSSFTKTGDIMGTPAFMAPEQARGETKTLDERCDVYGLGSILCVILTGLPPLHGTDAMNLVMQCMKGELEDAFTRLNSCGADHELIALAKRCLAPKKEDRPLHAGEVADAVECYQTQVQERLRQAELEKAQAQVQAEEERKRREVEQARAEEEVRRREAEHAKVVEERRRRRITLALAAALLLLVIGAGSAAFWYVNDRNQRTAEASLRVATENAQRFQLNNGVKTALDDTEKQTILLRSKLAKIETARVLMSDLGQWRFLRKSARSAWQRADALAASNRKLLGHQLQQRLDSLAEKLNADEKHSDLAFRLDQIRLESLTLVSTYEQIDPVKTAKNYAQAFREAEFDLQTESPEVIAARIRQSSARFALTAALDHWTEMLMRHSAADHNPKLIQHITQIARRADPHPWRDQVRDPDNWRSLSKLDKLAGEVNTAEHLPSTLTFFASLYETAGGNPLGVLRAASVQYPNDFWLHADMSRMTTNIDERIAYVRVALSLRPRSRSVLNNLGIYLKDRDSYEEAFRYLNKLIEIDPNYAPAYNTFGAAYRRKGEPRTAIKYFRKSLELDPNNSATHSNLGLALKDIGDLKASVEQHHKALEVDPTYYEAHYNLGLHYQLGVRDYQKAIGHYRKALQRRPNHKRAITNLGLALHWTGKTTEGIKHYHKALKIDPELQEAHSNLAFALVSIRKYREAIPHFHKALKYVPKDSELLLQLAYSLGQIGDGAGEVATYQKVLKTVDPNNSSAHYNLGIYCYERGKRKEAIEHYRNAIAANPRFANAHTNLALVLKATGDVPGAMKHYQKAIQIKPDHYVALTNLAGIYRDQNKADTALEFYRKAVKANPRYGLAHHHLANLLHDRGDLHGAAEHLKQVLQITPNNTLALNGLGMVYHDLHDYNRAIEQFHKALRINARQYDAHFNLGNSYSAAGQLEKAVASFKKSLEIAPSYAEAWCNLGHDLKKQGKYAEALSAFTRGHAIGSKRSNWRYASDRWIKCCQRIIALSKRESVEPILINAAGATIKGKLDKTDPLDIYLKTDKSYRKAYGIRFLAGKTYQIDLTGDFDTYLRIEDELYRPQLANDDVHPPKDLNSRLLFTPTKNGVYRLVATSYRGGTTGTFQIQVREAKKSGDAMIIKSELTTKDKINTDGRYYKLHKFKLTAGRPCTIELESDAFNTYLFLQDPEGKRRLAHNDDSPQGNDHRSRIDFTPEKTATYLVRPTSYQRGRTGPYVVRVQEYAAAKQE